MFEREYLLAQVTRFGGNISRTAAFVGMERSALHRKLKSFGVFGTDAPTASVGDDDRATFRLKSMSRIAYVNGRYLPHREAAVHIEDRGFQFADGVYEVIAVKGGRFVDEAPHLARLHRSLARIAHRGADGGCRAQGRDARGRAPQRRRDGIVYLQVTRGSAPREFAFPKAARPRLVMTARRTRPPDPRLGEEASRS